MKGERGGRYRKTGGEGWMKGDEGREKLKGNSFRYLPVTGTVIRIAEKILARNPLQVNNNERVSIGRSASLWIHRITDRGEF